MSFHNKLGSEIDQVVERGMNRLTLSYWNLNFGVEGAHQVMRALTDWRNEIRELFLWGNRLNVDEWRVLQEGLVHENCKVQVLGVEENAFHSLEAVELLCAVLTHPNNKIQWLNLSNTCFSQREALSMLSKAIVHRNCKIESLFLDSNEINDEGSLVLTAPLMALAKSSSVSPSKLVYLSLRRNRINHQGTDQLVQIAKFFPSPLSMNVVGNVRSAQADETRLVLARVVQFRNSMWYDQIMCLLSVRDVTRLGYGSTVKLIPKELIRKIAEALPAQ